MHKLITRRKLFQTQVTTISYSQVAQTDTQVVHAGVATTQQVVQPQPDQNIKTVDNLLTQKSKRRLIQISFELLGSPDEFDDEENNQWLGKDGVVNVIRDFIGLKSHRVRSQILSVLRFVTQANEQGVDVVDAGTKSDTPHLVVDVP